MENAVAIRAERLRKQFRGAPPGTGLVDFSLSVPKGSICGLIGPNGAGKTTAVRILSTLLQPNSGRAEIDGIDLRRGDLVRERMGLVGQQAAVDEVLDGRQNLQLFGRLRHLTRAQTRSRAEELLAQFDLLGAGNLPVARYSGGMRRRLDLALSLITAPAVLFVDEPTTGLDPVGRQEVWAALRALVAQGTTVLLTTQHLEEADALADTIAFLKAGRVVAEGSPEELKNLLEGDWIDVVPVRSDETQRWEDLAARVASGPVLLGEGGRLSIPVRGRTKALLEFAALIQAAGLEPLDLGLRRPTLDEVFLHLAQSPTTETPL